MSPTDERWTQFLLVFVPVMSLIGAWLALKTYSDRRRRGKEHDADRR